MAANGSLASCKKLQTDAAPGVQQQQYYALVMTNTQQQTFDLSVTDGQTAWRGTGLRVSRPPGFGADEAWSRARELLTDSNTAAKPAALRANELQNGELQFVWSWEREVGAGRHVMKLPDQTAAAAAAASGAAAGQQQQPGVLVKQQPPHSTIKHILDTLATSYGTMQSSLASSSSAQLSLESSLSVLRGQLDSQAAAHKDRERELYLKFTMLLNQKTRQLQKEHEMVKQLSAEVERLKGEGDADTDDEALQAAYAADEAAAELTAPGDPTAAAAGDADTEPGSDEATPAAAAARRPPAAAAAGTAAGRVGSTRLGTAGLVIPDSEGVDADGTAAAAGAAGGGPGGGGAAGGQAAAGGGQGQPMDVDIYAAETQLLPDSQLLDLFKQGGGL